MHIIVATFIGVFSALWVYNWNERRIRAAEIARGLWMVNPPHHVENGKIVVHGEAPPYATPLRVYFLRALGWGFLTLLAIGCFIGALSH